MGTSLLPLDSTHHFFTPRRSIFSLPSPTASYNGRVGVALVTPLLPPQQYWRQAGTIASSTIVPSSSCTTPRTTLERSRTTTDSEVTGTLTTPLLQEPPNNVDLASVNSNTPISLPKQHFFAANETHTARP